MPFLPRHLLALALSLLSASAAAAQVVINEIFYDPANGSPAPEFVELYNAGSSAVDMSGWKFDSGVNYTFSASATIAAHGYLVVTADPSAFQSAFGASALGPWSGKLSNSGERVRLVDASGQTVDSVTYGVGFPWPTAARGEGSSIELINPSLDHNDPGSWRASGHRAGAGDPQTFVPRTDPSWHYRKGTNEASSPVSAWRQLGFVEDSSWLVGQTSIGFDDNDDNTILSDMSGGSYNSLYLRRIFNVARLPDTLTLRVRVDDGCIVWINGTEVARFHVTSGDKAYNALAESHEADVVQFEETTLTNVSSYLVQGQNVIAIHALDSRVKSMDFTIDAELVEGAGGLTSNPTPGAVNSVFAAAAPPSITQVSNTPLQPATGQTVTVTARIVDAAGGSSVSLSYQIVNPGSYIRREDPTYEPNWTSLAMRDDGTNGDAIAGDHIYTATLPGTLQTHRRLVRYRITATGADGLSQQVPYADDGSPNFAYFVYDGVPNWSGAFDPGSTAVRTFTSSVLDALPVYQIIADKTDVTNSQYNSTYDGTRMWGTFVCNGQVFDHIQFYNRGEASTYVSGKNKWRIKFNTARDFLPSDNWGRPVSESVDTINLNANASPWAAVHRGMAGMEEALSFRAYELAGIPAPRTTYIHFRVIDQALETSTSSQFEGGNPSVANGGDLWGLYLYVEQPDGSFLDERGMDDGNIYKIESSTGDSKHHASGQPSDGSDWAAFLAGSKNASQTEAWWRANLDLPRFYTFMALNRLLGNVDLRYGYNHLFYHAPDDRWIAMPWDLDMMFIPKTHQAGVIDQNRCLNVPALALEYRNRAREILDLFASDNGIAGGQIGQLVDEYSQMVHPKGQSLTWVDLDAAMWNQNPRTPSNGNAQTNHRGNFFKTPYTDSRNGGTWVRTLSSADHAGQVKYLIDYATNAFPAGSTWAVNNGDPAGYGYQYLASEAADSSIPSRPTATYAGPPDYPINNLRFQTSAYSGVGAFSALQWRIAEISAPGLPLYDATKPRIYELTDVWRSEEIPTFTAETLLPGSNLQAGHTYRVRVRHKDATGRWSRWSEPVQFVAGAAAAQPTASNLVIAELMYNPSALTPAETAAGISDKQDLEYVTLRNIGATPIDLGATAFTKGITFAFPSGTTLAPGASLLVVKNAAAFTVRYGSDKPIAGAYSGNLDNAGEQIILSAGGMPIIDFAYSDGSHPATGQLVDPWPPEADGNGYSLVLDTPDVPPNYSLASSWRVSRTLGGSPGAADTIDYTTWANQHPGIGFPTENPDNDARDNHAEYVFGSDPTVYDPPDLASLSIQPLSVDGAPTADYLTIVFRRQVGATDISYAVESSADLVTWIAAPVLVSRIPNGDGTATETWRDAQPIGSSLHHFMRVRQTAR